LLESSSARLTAFSSRQRQQLTVAQVGQLMQTRSRTKAHTQAAPPAGTSKAHSGSSSSSCIEESEDSTSDSG